MSDEQDNMPDDTEKLIMLADAMSDVVYGGERGWELVDFKDFIQHCRDAIRKKGVEIVNQQAEIERLEGENDDLTKQLAELAAGLKSGKRIRTGEVDEWRLWIPIEQSDRLYETLAAQEVDKDGN